MRVSCTRTGVGHTDISRTNQHLKGLSVKLQNPFRKLFQHSNSFLLQRNTEIGI